MDHLYLILLRDIDKKNYSIFIMFWDNRNMEISGGDQFSAN